MLNESIECLLGRMEQKIEDIQSDLKDIKEEQKRLAAWVDTERIGMKLLTALAVSLGGLFVYYKEHLENFIFGSR